MGNGKDTHEEIDRLRGEVAALRHELAVISDRLDQAQTPEGLDGDATDDTDVPLGKVELLELVSSSSVRVRTAYVHLGASSASPTGITLELSPVVENVEVGSSTLAQVRRRALVVSGRASSSSLADIVDEQV